MVGVELLEVRVGGRGCGERVALPVGPVARVERRSEGWAKSGEICVVTEVRFW